MGYRRVLAALSAAGAAWAAVLIVGSLAGARLLPDGVAELVAAALVTPGFVVAVFTGKRNGGLDGFLPFVEDLPWWVRTFSLGLFLAFWIAMATSFIGIGGSAEIVNGQYVLNSHGTPTVVDKAAYDRELGKELRILLGVLGAFGAAGAALNAAAAARPAPPEPTNTL
jgi:hypothetical protein